MEERKILMSAPIEPIVTVVIPNYNCGVYIRETLESIAKTVGATLEVIIVDDASTDNSREVITEMVPYLQNVRTIFLDRNHGGPSKPRNVGLEAARGKYVCFVDADDLLLPDTLGDAVAFHEEHPGLGFVFYDALKFDEIRGDYPATFLSGYSNFREIDKERVSANRYVIRGMDAHQALFFENYVLTPGVIIRREVLHQVGPFDEELTNGDDRDMWFRITREYDIGFIDKVGFRYRVRPGSISFRGSILAENRIRVIRKHMNLGGISRSVHRQASKLIANNLYGIGYQHQSAGEFSTARKKYFQSLRESVSSAAIKGVLVTLWGNYLYGRLKKIKTEVIDHL